VPHALPEPGSGELVHLAYTETQRGGHLISAPDEVSILERKYAMLRSQALNPDETIGLLNRLLGESDEHRT
jgi:hypothetical protein